MEERSKPAPKKLCFVICPIGSEASEERKWSDTTLKHIFKKALEPLGYKVVRADHIAQPGMITMQVLQHLMSAEIVVADMTGHNANVFYELAVRHAVGKPVIHVIREEERIPFDVADLRTIFISIDLDGAETSVSAIQQQAKEIEAGKVGDTPVKIASIVQQLGKSTQDEILRDVLTGLSALRAEIRLLQTSQPPTLLVESPKEMVAFYNDVFQVKTKTPGLKGVVYEVHSRAEGAREQKAEENKKEKKSDKS